MHGQQNVKKKAIYLFINISSPGYITLSFGMTGDVELEAPCKKELV